MAFLLPGSRWQSDTRTITQYDAEQHRLTFDRAVGAAASLVPKLGNLSALSQASTGGLPELPEGFPAAQEPPDRLPSQSTGPP